MVCGVRGVEAAAVAVGGICVLGVGEDGKRARGWYIVTVSYGEANGDS